MLDGEEGGKQWSVCENENPSLHDLGETSINRNSVVKYPASAIIHEYDAGIRDRTARLVCASARTEAFGDVEQLRQRIRVLNVLALLEQRRGPEPRFAAEGRGVHGDQMACELGPGSGCCCGRKSDIHRPSIHPALPFSTTDPLATEHTSSVRNAWEPWARRRFSPGSGRRGPARR